MVRALVASLILAGAAPAAAAQPGLADAVLARINTARADPAGYARGLERYAESFEGNTAYPPEDPDGRATQEGTRAVDEAIAFLRRQPPLPPLARGAILARAAAAFAEEEGESGRVGHYGAGGSTPASRVMGAGGGGFVAEVIAYGGADAETVVRQFVVDDGVPSRGHRALLFAPVWRFAGAGCADHRGWRVVCVVELGQTADGQPGPRLLPPGVKSDQPERH